MSPQISQEMTAIVSLYQSAEVPMDAEPGSVVAVLKNVGPVVQTGDGHLLLLAVKPAGKKMLSGWDFANGSRLVVGDCIG